MQIDKVLVAVIGCELPFVGEFQQRQRQRPGNGHLKINIWAIVSILRLSHLVRILRYTTELMCAR